MVDSSSSALFVPTLDKKLLWLNRGASTLVACCLFAIAFWSADAASQAGREDAIKKIASIPPHLVVRSQVLERKHRLMGTREAFAESAIKDAEAFGVADFRPESLHDAQPYHRYVTTPISLASGQRRRFGPFEVHALNKSVAYQRGGATLRAQHSVLEITNRSRDPLAYYVMASLAGRGHCPARGSIQANVMALKPNEHALLTICAGEGKIEVSDLRGMTVSALGYHYLTRMPPQSFGLDAITSRAHVSADLCSRVPSSRLASAQKSGSLHWEDVVDFYSRHSCERHQIPPEYRHSDSPVAILPFGSSDQMQEAMAQDATLP